MYGVQENALVLFSGCGNMKNIFEGEAILENYVKSVDEY